MTYDAIVAGGGPGGSTAGALLAEGGLRTLVVDKYAFPRDKICGDAISGKSMGVLRRLGIEEAAMRLPQTVIRGVTFSGPGGDEVSIPFSGKHTGVPGVVCRREIYDDLILGAARRAGADIWESSEVRGLLREGDRVVGATIRRDGRSVDVRAPIVIGADGAYSTVARELGQMQLRPAHYVAGLRQYYENFGGAARSEFIELHFVDEVLPGYFWIFELPNGGANVGVGMLSATVKRRGIRLKELLREVVASRRFAGRFADAKACGPAVGWGIPLGSRPRRMAGSGWMLVGDAASLIDPFTGEGIGNAMLSGMRAAEWTIRAHERDDFSEPFLRGYAAEVLDELRSELRLSYALQRMLRWRGLVDLIIRKAARSDVLASTISCMFDDLSARRRLLSPMFYVRALRS